MPFTIVRLGLFFFNLEISELDWNRNRISCYVFIHYTYNFLSDEITRNYFFHFSKKIRFTRVLLIISRIQTMDVKLLSESPFVFPFSFYPCMWTSVFLLHPVCFSALRLFCLALFMWLPVALSYVNLVRQLGVEQPCVVGRRDCFTLRQPSAPSSVTSLRLFFSQICREVVLLGWLWTQWDCCPVFHGRDIRNHLLNWIVNWVWNQNSKTQGKTIVWCLCGSQLEFILPTLERFWDFSSFWLCEYSTEKQNTILC